MKFLKFLLIFVLITGVISSCQSQPGNVFPTLPIGIASPTGIGPAAGTPTLVSDSAVVSAESCASASGPAPSLVDPTSSPAGVDVVGPIELSLGGGVVQSKEFTIELLLYCNPAYGPISMEPYFLSDVRGLAIYYQWRYDGTVENGPTYVFSGFVPDLDGYKAQEDALRQGQLNPPSARGIHFPGDLIAVCLHPAGTFRTVIRGGACI